MLIAVSYICFSSSYTLLNFSLFAFFLGVIFTVLFIFYRSLIPRYIITESPVIGINYPLGSTMSSPSRFNSPKINLLENSLRRKPLYLKNDSIHSSPVASSPSSPCNKGQKLDSSFTFSNDITSLSNCGGSFESPDNSRLSVGEFPLISLTSGIKKSLTPKAPKLEPKSISLKIEVPEPTSTDTTDTSASPDPLLNILRTFNRKRKTLTPVEADSGASLSNGTPVSNDFETSIEDNHPKKMTRHNLCASLLESQLSIPSTPVEKIPINVTSKRTREEAGLTSGTKRHCSKLSSEIISSLSSMKKFHHKKSAKRKFKENSGGVMGNIEKMPRTSLRLPKNKISFIDTEFDTDVKKPKKYAEQGTQVDNEVIDSSPKQTVTADASCSTPEAVNPSLPVIKIKRDTVSERVVTRAIVNSHLQYQSAIAKFMMGGHPAFLGMKPNGTEPRQLEMQPLPFGPASQSVEKTEGEVGGSLGGSGLGFSLQAGVTPSLTNPLLGSPTSVTSAPSNPVTSSSLSSSPLVPTTTSISVPSFQFTPASSSAPITSTAGSGSSLSTLQFKAPDPKPPATTSTISGAKPGGFSFGLGSTSTTVASTTTCTPTATTTTTPVTSTSNPTLPTSSTSTPQFGLSTATTSTFTFKSPAVSSAEQKPISTPSAPSVTFGVSSSTFKIPGGASSAGPSFGLGSTSSSTASPKFSFSSKPNENATTSASPLSTTSTAPSIFSFGTSSAVKQTSAPASTTVTTPSTTSATPSLFSSTPLSFSSPTTLNFASGPTPATTVAAFGASIPINTSAPSFSSATSSPFAASSTPGSAPTFGTQNSLFSLKPTTTAAGFAAPTTTSIFSTPANSSTPATTASLFCPNPSNLFGNPTVTTTAAAPTANTPFGSSSTFGAPTTSASVFGSSTFGGSTFTNPGTSPFPPSTSAPKFGPTTGGFGTTTTASSVFSFGNTTPTTTAPNTAFQFGNTTPSKTAPNTAFQFGQNSTTTASPFRSSTTPSFGPATTPAFGIQTTSAFGTPAASGSLFGASSGGGSFNTPTTTTTPAFGNAVPTFGSATTTTAPTATTTSIFRSVPSNSKPFEFSSGQKTGGFKFSLSQSQANPSPFQAAPTPFQSATTTSAFVFGQNNTTLQQAKPFQFPSGTPAFGATPNAASAFATPGPSTAFQFNATPQQQAPGSGQPMFSIGTGSPTPARNKRDTRPRRR